jgi:hypothetical protein
MTFKELLIQELDNIPDPLIGEVLDFLHFLKAKHRIMKTCKMLELPYLPSLLKVP